MLKTGGISYNTIPALNLWWFTRFYNTIPDLPILKNIFEFILVKVFKGKALKKHWGYQQAFTKYRLKKLHKDVGFKDIVVGPFAFHPSDGKLKSRFLRNVAYKIRCWSLLTAIYFVYARK